MRILVISDTHRKTGRAAELLKDMAKRVHAVIHLGDNIEDAELLKKIIHDMPVYMVAGNCDKIGVVPLEVLLHIGGKRVFFTHGHTYNVNYTTARLERRAEEMQADICLYGHTHKPDLQMKNGIFYLNPGSLSEPRGESRASYGIIKIEDDKVYPMVIPYI